MSWEEVRVEEGAGGSVFGCRVKPGARRTEVLGPYGERVKIAVDAEPRRGEANERLVRFLADLFGCSRRDVEILSGEGARDKRVLVRGRPPASVRAGLREAADAN